MSILERIDATTKIPASHLSVVPPAPRSVKFELTGVCNLRCQFCALTKRAEQPTKPVEWEFVDRVFREVREFGVKEIGLFYIGESFTCTPLLVKSTALADELGFENIFLTSNATLAYPDRVEAVIRAGLTSLKWSVNNATAEQFTKVTKRPGRLFYAALDNIKAAKAVRDRVFEETGHRCDLSMSTIKYDEEHMGENAALKALWETLLPYVDTHYQLPLYTMGGAPVDQELALGITPTAGNQGRIGALVEPLPCWALFTEGHVTACHKLSACCFDADGSWTMADLDTMTFAEAWHSQDFQALRKAHLAKNVKGTVCETCALYT